MKKIYIIPLLAAGLLATGCSKENPFTSDDNGEGQVLKSSLDMSVSGNDVQVNPVATRADADVDVNDFNVHFIKTGQTISTKSFKYGEMPEVVTLPSGEYTVTATLGEDRVAEWENPYFTGQSETFEVNPMEITSYISPIECSLRNIKVTIEFDPLLKQAMSEDAFVEVKVGDNSGLNYTAAEASEGKAGYFRHTDESTLVATFQGNINGSKVVETKSYSDIKKGCWYKLTFKLHDHNGSASGSVGTEIQVDAHVDVTDVNADVDIAFDDPLDDNDRPHWGGGDEPDPPVPGQAPQILAVTSGMVFDTPWNVTSGTECKFRIESSADGGIQELTCDIISDALTPDELAGVGLAQHLDLVNTPADMAGALSGLGFPVNVGGQKTVNFDITSFMPMMAVFGSQMHQFKLYVKDANGETTKILKLQF